MTGNQKGLSKFWLELKRRKTDRVVILYAASAYTILQLADILRDSLVLPSWTTRFILIVLIIGFPVAVVFSWFFDITPGGIQKTKPLSDKSRQRMEAQLKTWKSTTLVSFIVIIGLICFNLIRNNINASEIRKTEKSIAVLPFENLAPDDILPNTSDAVTSIIRTGLYDVKDLKVASRLSLHGYKPGSKSIADIAKQLDVYFIVSGELIDSKDLIIVNVTLTRAVKNREFSIWGGRYSFNPKGNKNELFEIPVEIARQLKMALSAEEKSRLRKKPTVNTAALLNYAEGIGYQEDAYNGFAFLSMGDSIFRDLSVAESFNRAILFYDKAIKADSNFALAYTKRALTRSWGYRAGDLTAKDHMDKCREDAEHALRIDPGLAEALVAYGFYYYYFEKDYGKALEYFSQSSDKEPWRWEFKFFMALVLRARGDWEKSQVLMAEVGRYDIQDPLFLTNIGLSYEMLREYDTAIYYHDRAIKKLPAWSDPYSNKITCYILRDGNTIKAEAVLDTALNRTTGGTIASYKILFEMYNGRFKEALLKAEVAGPDDFSSPGSRFLLLAMIYDNLNNPQMASEHYKSAFEYFSKEFAENPDDQENLSFLGISAAGLKDNAKAIYAGLKALEMTKINYIEQTDCKRALAQIYAMTGEYDKCLELLDELLRTPSSISVKILQVEPDWIPLRKLPGFRALIARYS